MLVALCIDPWATRMVLVLLATFDGTINSSQSQTTLGKMCCATSPGGLMVAAAAAWSKMGMLNLWARAILVLRCLSSGKMCPESALPVHACTVCKRATLTASACGQPAAAWRKPAGFFQSLRAQFYGVMHPGTREVLLQACLTGPYTLIHAVDALQMASEHAASRRLLGAGLLIFLEACICSVRS